MAAVTIAGQVRELRYTAAEITRAEKECMANGGRPLLSVIRADTIFAMHELEWLVWGAWRATLSDARIRALLAQFYAEGGTVLELHGAVVNALLESGVIVKRPPEENGAGPPEDPPGAGSAS